MSSISKIASALPSAAPTQSTINKIVELARNNIFLTAVITLGAGCAIGYAVHKYVITQEKPIHSLENSPDILKLIKTPNFKFKDFAETCRLDVYEIFRCVSEEKDTFNKNIDDADFKKLRTDPKSVLRQSANIAYFLLADTDNERSNRLGIVKTNLGSTREAINRLVKHSYLEDKKHPIYKWCINHIKTSIQKDDIPSAVQTLKALKNYHSNCKFWSKMYASTHGHEPTSNLPPSISEIMADLSDDEKSKLPKPLPVD